jgi:hypothetical protein
MILNSGRRAILSDRLTANLPDAKLLAMSDGQCWHTIEVEADRRSWSNAMEPD